VSNTTDAAAALAHRYGAALLACPVGLVSRLGLSVAHGPVGAWLADVSTRRYALVCNAARRQAVSTASIVGRAAQRDGADPRAAVLALYSPRYSDQHRALRLARALRTDPSLPSHELALLS